MGLSTSHTVTEIKRRRHCRAEPTVIFDGEKRVIIDGESQVTTHKREASATVFDGGSRIEVKRERHKIEQRGGGGRGVIREFSYNSRRRLLRRMAELRREVSPIFATLTYPAEYPVESKVYKEHLRVFGIYLRRRYPGCGFIWRLEFQKRGAAHFHLLIYGEKRLSIPWIAQTWYQIVGSGDEKHLKAGTRVEHLRSYRQAVGYMSKALAKVHTGEMGKQSQATVDNVGRWWGMVGAECLPWALKRISMLSDVIAKELIRYMRKYAKLRSRYYPSLSIFCVASDWLRLIDGLLNPEPVHLAGVLRSPIFA